MLPILAQIAINQKSIDYVSWMTQEIDSLTDSHAGLFVGAGFVWLTGLFFLMCFKTFAMWGIFSRHDAFDVQPIVELFVKWAIAYSALSFYTSPIPGTSVSFHQVFSQEARWIAATIDLSSVNTLMSALASAAGNLQVPGITNVLGVLVYGLTMVDFAVIWAVSFLVPISGYCALAVGSLVGPLLIPLLIVPTFSSWALSWFRFMVIYSLWRVVASALVYIWANFMVEFFNRIIGRDYSLGHFLWITPVMGAMVVGFAYTLFQTHRISSDLVGGSASLGSPIGGVARFVGAAVAAA